MKTRTTFLICLILAGLAILTGAYLYPMMGERMAIHWGPEGRVDGYGSRFEGLFLLPIIALAVSFLMIGMPLLDPLKKNIEKFRSEYNLFVLFMSAFFYYLYALTLFYNFGFVFSMTAFLMPAFALMMIFAGWLLGRAKRNYFVGIRTPWTLASETVWERTHRFGGKAFQAAGILCLAGMLFPPVAFLIMMVAILGAAFLVVLYSYLVFRQEEKRSGG